MKCGYLETEIEGNEQAARELSLDSGRKLRRIKDQELYRERRQSSFLNYVENHLKRMKRWAYQLIEAANVVDVPVRESAFPPPTTAWQARPLAQIEEADQAKVWERATESNKGKPPSGRQLQGWSTSTRVLVHLCKAR